MAFTTDDLLRIERAIAKGERRVTFSDRTVEYRDISELMQARDAVQTEIRKQSGATRRVRPMRSTGF